MFNHKVGFLIIMSDFLNYLQAKINYFYTSLKSNLLALLNYLHIQELNPFELF